MPRRARIVIPGIPHHIVQRGIRKQDVFYSGRDKRRFMKLLEVSAQTYGLTILAYCLMRNHIHYIVIPSSVDSLHLTFKKTHGVYAQELNERMRWIGPLWQGRFFSSPMDETYLYHAIRYVEMNPVRANIVQSPADYVWSSARSRVHGKPDKLLNYTKEQAEEHLPRHKNWLNFLKNVDEPYETTLRKHTSQNIPCGKESFVVALEEQYGVSLRYRKPGRPHGGKKGDRPY